MRRLPLIILSLLVSVQLAGGEPSLPLGEKAELTALRANCERLIAALDRLGAPLDARTREALEQVLHRGDQDAQATEKVQRLLDPLCLVGVTINPESRVKAARGAAPAELLQGQWVTVLAKVHNDAGVTQRLTLSGPQIESDSGQTDRNSRWLQAAIYAERPMSATLSGQPLEYVILRLRSRQTGKREATLTFDVGQGTQDLGFRAEVPILFRVKPGNQ